MMDGEHQGSRLLICAPGSAFGEGEISGHHHVLLDLAAGLSRRGWQVDTLLGTAAAQPEAPPGAFRQPAWQFRLGQGGRVLKLPEAWRLRAGFLMRGRAHLRHLSDVLYGVQSRVESGAYDAVLACLDGSPVGLAAFVSRAHPSAVLTSLGGLGFELRQAGALRSVRAAARLAAGRSLHSSLYATVRPSYVRAAAFGSAAWRDEAVAAGLPLASTRVIHFGVEVPGSLRNCEPVRTPARLLWAARLSPEKGLHLFLPALSLLRREQPVRLTILAAPGPPPYRLRVERMIDQLRLRDIVDCRPPVSREALPPVLASHDVLLFHSAFREPVAQMLLLALAHGLVVAGPASPDPRSLLRDRETAFCFDDGSPARIAATVHRAILETDARRSVRQQAFTRVASEHDQSQTIAAYDALLADVIAGVGGRRL